MGTKAHFQIVETTVDMKNQILRFSLLGFVISLGLGMSVTENYAQARLGKRTLDCRESRYRHKADSELAVMTPFQLVEESVKEQLYHMPSFDTYSGEMLNKHLRLHEPAAVLGVLSSNIRDHDPTGQDRCEKLRFLVSVGEARGLDRGKIRLRSISEGLAVINALEQVLDRMKKAGFDQEGSSTRGEFHFHTLQLKGLRSTNERDELIRNTLQKRHNIIMSDTELLEFSEFLISIDPAYPSWSEIDDGQSLLLNKSEKYWQAYQAFKVTRR